MVIAGKLTYDCIGHRIFFEILSHSNKHTATDMPDYDDRKELEGESKEQATHYSKTLDRNSLYGEGKVYVDRKIAHEKIVMIMQDETPSMS